MHVFRRWEEGKVGPRMNLSKKKKKKTGTNMSVYIVGGGVGRKNPLERLKTERNLC